MSIQVKTFNDSELKKAIKECPPIIQEYIASLQKLIDMDYRNMEIFSKKWQQVPPDIQAVINKEFNNLI